MSSAIAAPHTSSEAGVWKCVVDGVLYGSDAEVAVWIKDRMGTSVPTTIPFVAFGIIENDQMVGGVAYWNYYDGEMRDITVTVALADDVNVKRQTVEKLLAYPFEQLKLPRITAFINMGNARAVEQAMKIGFRLEGRMRKAAQDGGDIGIFGLLASECQIWTQRRTAD